MPFAGVTACIGSIYSESMHCVMYMSILRVQSAYPSACVHLVVSKDRHRTEVVAANFASSRMVLKMKFNKKRCT